MAKCSLNFEEMKKTAVEIYDGMVVKFPLKQDYTININEIYANIKDHNYRLYNINKDTIVFFDGNGRKSERGIFVFPKTAEAVKVLEEEKFVFWDSLWVPFSNDDYPEAEVEQWKMLVNHYQKPEMLRIRRMECLYQAKDLGIRKISKPVLRDFCMKIPDRGIKIYNKEYDSYGWLKPRMSDQVDLNYIGTYNVKNGVCEFVDADGDTYLSKACGIVEELRNHGFRQTGFEVRLSNSEEIICDESIKHEWRKKPFVMESIYY